MLLPSIKYIKTQNSFKSIFLILSLIQSLKEIGHKNINLSGHPKNILSIVSSLWLYTTI